MSVRRQRFKDRNHVVQEFWIVDVVFEHPDGRRERVRKVSPVPTRRGAEAYERELRQALLSGAFGRKEKTEPQLFANFAKEFLETYAQVNNKPSEYKSKESMLRVHLTPAFGHLRLDSIGAHEIDAFKSRTLKNEVKPKTVNNILHTLHRLFVIAESWGLLERVPKIRMLKSPKPDFDFLDFEEAERLIAAADPEWRCMILLAVKTGLR